MTGSSTIRRLAAARQGQTMAEYGIILALIAVVAFISVQALGVDVKGAFDFITGKI